MGGNEKWLLTLWMLPSKSASTTHVRREFPGIPWNSLEEVGAVPERAAVGHGQHLKISVVGHTDSTGDYSYNVRLSERRARAFASALVKEGIAANRLTAVGVGPQSPVATNDTPEGRAQNRRVELVVMR